MLMKVTMSEQREKEIFKCHVDELVGWMQLAWMS